MGGRGPPRHPAQPAVHTAPRGRAAIDAHATRHGAGGGSCYPLFPGESCRESLVRSLDSTWKSRGYGVCTDNEMAGLLAAGQTLTEAA